VKPFPLVSLSSWVRGFLPFGRYRHDAARNGRKESEVERVPGESVEQGEVAVAWLGRPLTWSQI
jgi:hypothetical protein